MDQGAILARLDQWISSQSDLQFAILFGSFAKGHARDSSDLDVALFYSAALSVDDRIAKASELSLQLGVEVDLVDLHSVRGAILEEILTKGKILKKNAATYAFLMKRMWFDREDFYPLRQVILKKRQKRAFG
jgi:predicted nucleotidyltransferase